jgi:hypothetical protein
MALFAASEFGSTHGDTQLYAEATEALSNQYFGQTKSNTGPMQCFGSCSLTNQLLWATQMEGFYRNKEFVNDNITNGAWTQHWDTGQNAAAGYSYGADTSWFWGNVSRDELGGYDYTAIRETNVYPGKPYFIVYAYQNY